MAKIARKKLKLFGSGGNASYFARFGSQRASDPVKTKDIDDIQSLTAWDNGLQDAVVSSNKAPFLEDINALMYVLAYQSVYQLQEGIAEYDTVSTYYKNSIVKKTATTEIYSSLTDDNVGNALPSQADNTNWKYLGDLAQLKYAASFPIGGIIMWSGTLANIPVGWTLCNGANGTPDLRDRFIMGAADGQNPGGTGGASTVTLGTENLPAHAHTMNHGHTASTGAAGAHSHTFDVWNRTQNSWFGGGGVLLAAQENNFANTGPSTAPYPVSAVGNHTHTATVSNHTGDTGSVGTATAFGIVPPFYKLAFIMKL